MNPSDKFHLLEVIDKQQTVIEQQHKSLFKLLSENVEQETVIDELMRGR